MKMFHTNTFRTALLGLAASAAAVALAFTPAGASEPTARGAPQWSGCYGGLHAGYGWADVSGRSSNTANNHNLPYDYDANGALAGVHVGCDFRVSSNLVLGFVGDLDWAGLDGNQDRITDPINFPGLFYNHTTDIDVMGSLRVRAGMVLPSNLLVYATGGYAFARTENSLGFSGAASPFLTYNDTRNGWTIGGGVEGYVLPNVTISLEYRFAQFEGGHVAAPAVNARDRLDDIDVHTVRLGFSIR